MMWPEQNFSEKDGKITMLHPTFFSCGCGSIISRYATVVQMTGLNKVPEVKPARHKIAKAFLEQGGYYDKIPLLKKHVYGVLINTKGEWLDISWGSTIKCAERFKEIYNEQRDT